MRFIRGALVAAVAIGGAMVLAPPASATITKTHISTPAKSPTYLTYNADKGNSFQVAGRTDSTDTTADTVDIRCFYGDDGNSLLVESGVPLQSNGSFSVSAPLNTVDDHECQLAALPSGDGTLESSFTGPQIEVSERQTKPISGGPNDGRPYDFYAYGQQTAVSDDYDSIGSCGLCDSYLQDNAGGVTSTVFFANAFLWYGNMEEQGDTRSEIKVDGRNAYVPAAAQTVFNGADQVPDFPTLSYKFSQNHNTGNVTITETDEIARCAGSAPYPPTSATCTAFKSTGVEVNRKIVQNASGQMVAITDSFTSTDGHAHKLDLLYENAQCVQNTTCEPPSVGYRFPGQHGYASHAPGDVVHVPAGVGSMYVRALGAPDGDPYTGQGAFTYGQAPTEILFIPGFSTPSGGSASEFTAHYKGKVPATGRLTYRFIYSTAYTYSQVHSDALAAQQALKKGGSLVAPAGVGTEQLPGMAPAEVPIPRGASKHGRL